MDYFEMELELPLPLMERFDETKYDESFSTMNLGDINILGDDFTRENYKGKNNESKKTMMDTPVSSVLDVNNGVGLEDISPVSNGCRQEEDTEEQLPLKKNNFFNFNWNDDLSRKTASNVPSSSETINCATLTSTEFLNNFLKGDFALAQGVFKPHGAPVTPPLDDQPAFTNTNDPAEIFMQNHDNSLYDTQQKQLPLHAGAGMFIPNNIPFDHQGNNNNLNAIGHDFNVDIMLMNPSALVNKIEDTKRPQKKRKMSKRKSSSESSASSLSSSSSDCGNTDHGRKCSDARLSAIGLAKKLNLSTPQEALEREKYILDIFQNELKYPLGYKTWIRDTDKETRTYLVEELHNRVKDRYPEYDHNILETIIRRATYSMMQSRLRRERRAKIKERTITSE